MTWDLRFSAAAARAAMAAAALCLCLSMFHAKPAAAVDEKVEVVRIGVLANRGVEQCLEDWTPTANYLTRVVPGYRFRIIPLGFAEVDKAVAGRSVDFLITNTAMAVDMEYAYGTGALATMVRVEGFEGLSQFGGVVFTRAGRTDIRSFADLRGKRFAAADMESLGGWKAAWAEFKNAGLDPFKDLGGLTFVQNQDDVVRAVLDGSADAGTVRTGILETMAVTSGVRLSDLRVLPRQRDTALPFPLLLSTRLYPEWPLCKLKDISDDLSNQVAAALLALHQGHPAAQAAGLKGWISPLSHEPVRDLMKDLRAGHFKDYGLIRPGEALRQYWGTVLVTGLALLCMALALGAMARLNMRLRGTQAKLRSELAERQRAEAELSRSREQYRLLLDESPVSIMSFDENGLVTFVNRWHIQIFARNRFEPAHYLGRRITELPGIVSAGLQKEMERILRGERVIIEGAFFPHFGDGRSGYLNVRGMPLLRAGLVAGGVLIRDDITELKLSELALKQSEARLQSIFEAAPIGIGLVVDRVMVQVNSSLCAMLGYSQDELCGQSARMLYPDDNEYSYVGAEKYRQIREKGTGSVETRWVCKDGRHIDVLLSSTPLDRDNLERGVTFTALDITERRRMETVLRESESRFRQLFENAPLAYQSLDESGHFLDVNKRWLDTLGYAKEEVLGGWFGDFLMPGYAEHFDRNFPMFKHACVIDGVEFEMRRKDGGAVAVSFNGRVQNDGQGRFQRTHCIFTDITVRRRAEAALRDSEKRLRSILENMPLIGISLDPTGRVIFANDFFLDLAGYARDEVIGRNWFDLFIPKDEWGTVRSVFTATMAKKDLGEMTHFENAILDSAGRLRLIAWSNVLTFNADGEVADVTCLGLDLTARREAEDALRESEERFRSVVHGSPLGIFICREDEGRLVLVEANAAADQQLEERCAALLGRELSEALPEPAQSGLEEALRRVLRTGQSWAGLNMRLSPGGREAFFDIWAFRAGSDRLALLFMDVTERHRAGVALQAATQAAEAASRAKSEFLAVMSHEIRTPLNGIMGMIQILRDTPLGGEQREYLDAAFASSRNLTQILSDVLDISRIEAGKLALHMAPFNVADAVAPVAGAFAEEARRKNIRLHAEVDPAMPSPLLGDAGRIRQVLFNLVGNALKFTEQGSVRIEAYSLPHAPQPGGVSLHLAVIDTGVGVPNEKLAEIFEPFTQVEGAYTRRHGGAGLGLSIVRRLVELMQGRLSICSEPGAGTEVHVTLPLKRAEAAEAADNDAAAPQAGQGLRRILVVEDERVNMLAVTRFLQKIGHETAGAADGRQALELLAARPYDVVLMDIQMPGMDGVETTRRLRQGEAGPLNMGTPVVALTAHAMGGDRERFISAGMNDYLAKPFDMAQLRGLLERIR